MRSSTTRTPINAQNHIPSPSYSAVAKAKKPGDWEMRPPVRLIEVGSKKIRRRKAFTVAPTSLNPSSKERWGIDAKNRKRSTARLGAYDLYLNVFSRSTHGPPQRESLGFNPVSVTYFPTRIIIEVRAVLPEKYNLLGVSIN
jgi:hypothetical protein